MNTHRVNLSLVSVTLSLLFVFMEKRFTWKPGAIRIIGQLAVLLLLLCSPANVLADVYVAQPSISLSWAPNSESDIQGYEAHKSNSVAGSYVKAHSGLIAQNSWIDFNITDGETYYYKLRAVDKSGNISGFSVESAAAAQPSILLSWAPNSETDIQGYEAHKSNSVAGSYVKAHSGLIAQNSWIDSNITDGETYYYKLRAVDTSGNVSGFSVESAAVVADFTSPTVSGNPTAGTYAGNVTVSLSSSEEGSIYYTTDGSAPTLSSQRYSAPIFIGTNTALRFFAIDLAGHRSEIVTSNYVILSHQLAITGGPSGTPVSVASGGSVNCSVTAQDSLGHAVSYQWSATGGSFSDSAARNPIWYAPVNMTGATQFYVVSVTASCGGASASGSFSQNVLSSPDEITITSGPSGAPVSVASGGSVNCSVTAQDSLGHAVSYWWSATGGSFNDSAARNPIWYAPENLGATTQSYTISVTVNCVNATASGSFEAQTLPAPIDDADGDGVSDDSDNCPLSHNPDQRNTDGDGSGDVCDDDDDNDGYSDALENAIGSDPLDANAHPPASTLTLSAVDTLLGYGGATRLDVLGNFYPTVGGPMQLDMTCMVAYRVSAPGIVSIDACGNLRALSEGVVSVWAEQVSAGAVSGVVEITVDTVAPYVDTLETLPYDGQGLDEDTNGNGNLDPGEDLDGDGRLDIDNGPTPRVPIDTALAFRVVDEALGSNVGIDASSVSMIVNGVEVPARIREISSGDAHEIDIIADNPGSFAFGEIVVAYISLSDAAGNVMSFEESFRIESAADHQWALDNSPVQRTTDLGDGTFELAVAPISDSVDDEPLSGATIVYSGAEPVAPGFGPVGELPVLDIATPVGIPMNIEPSVVFDGLVTISIPAPGAQLLDVDGNGTPDTGLENYHIYRYSAEPSMQWRAADASGWMVPGSRVNRYDTVPPSIEIQITRSGGVQLGYECQSPYANFTAISPQVNVGVEVAFFDESAGSVTSWSWDFGDGATSTERDPAHAYWAQGDYDVTLTVSGPCGEDTLVKQALVSVCEGIRLLAPADGASARKSPVFAWTPGCNSKFVLEFSLAPDFSSTIKETQTISRTSMRIPGRIWKRLPLATVLYWRVKSADGSSVSEVGGVSRY